MPNCGVSILLAAKGGRGASVVATEGPGRRLASAWKGAIVNKSRCSE